MLLMLMLKVHFFTVLSFALIVMRSSVAIRAHTIVLPKKVMLFIFLIMIGFFLCTRHLESGQLIRKKLLAQEKDT